MTEHRILCQEAVFDVIACGDRAFEVTRNTHEFQKGDIAVLVRCAPENWPFASSGRSMRRKITHVMYGEGVEEGYVILGLKEL